MSEKVIVIHPLFRVSKQKNSPDADYKLNEAVGLAQAIELDVVYHDITSSQTIHPGHFLGKGAIEKIKPIIDENKAGLVVINHTLSPVQQRNLEKELGAKVIDRTGLILEIFGARARTKEGKLQVELAALSYQRSRLVRSWTHLERQRGGFGFMGGPGESQIEIDRRLIDERLARIKAELEQVRKNRALQREARQRVPFPIVALVGYTNAGKSSLFNVLTGANVFAKDLLFATLDTTMRGLTLPSGRNIILSDTVGFISDLPHQLVAAFRATLEEIAEATIILHVRDIASSSHEEQKADVYDVLKELGIDPDLDPRIIDIQNKIDLLPKDTQKALLNKASRHEKMAALSALTGEGIDQLLQKIDGQLSEHDMSLKISIPMSNGKAIAWVYEHAYIISRVDKKEMMKLELSISEANLSRLKLSFPDLFQKQKPSQKKA
jgi:GTP-binding protein HflX